MHEKMMADKMAKQKSLDLDKRKHTHRNLTHEKTYAPVVFHKEGSEQ